MNTFFYFTAAFISAFCNIAIVLMIVRAILSWFPTQGGKFAELIYALTEPLLYPARKLFELLGIDLNMPIDLSFSVTFFLLLIIRMILS